MRFDFFIIAFCFLLPAPTADVQWTTYRNERWSFCVEAPKSWRMGEGVNGAGGRFFLPGNREASSVAVGALPNQCVDTHAPYGPRCDRRQTLQEIENGEVSELKEEGVTELTTLSSSKQSFQGVAALLTRRSYQEKGVRVIDQTLSFLVNDTSYAIEFQCRPADVDQCDAVFRHVAATFRLHCE